MSIERYRRRDGKFGTQPGTEVTAVNLEGEAPAVMSGREADQFADDFFRSDHGADYGEICDDPEWSRGACVEVSEAFADYLHSIGERTAKSVDATASGHEYVEDGECHSVVEVRGLVIDLTHRQFDPDAPVPMTSKTDEFYLEWTAHSKQ